MPSYAERFWVWLYSRIVQPASGENQISRFLGTGEVPVPVRIKGDIRVCVPDSLEVMTSYILLEQEDWFEDEIGFVRRLLRPGMQVIDIGANYGVYTLSMAKAVAPDGKVYAFEPASKTAQFLDAGVAVNQFRHVQVINAALSDFNGEGRLSAESHSETNRLVNQAASVTAQEAVRVCTLDHCASEYGWKRIDFIKLDAEGAEGSIIKGGANFFAACAPLLLVEFKHGPSFNFPLIPAFADIGYAPYRLVPGLQLLVPFDVKSDMEPYLLNLFFCKPHHARLLEERGLLTTEQNPGTPELSRIGWRDRLAGLPYARGLLKGWTARRQEDKSSDSPDYEAALDFHAFACREDQHPGKRYAALRHARMKLAALAQANPSGPRLMSLARVNADLGLRSNALDVLDQLRRMGTDISREAANEPFLAVSDRFENMDPGNELTNWMLAAVLDQMEMLGTYSGYFSGMTSLGNLQAIQQLGFCRPEIERRLRLLEMRHRTR